VVEIFATISSISIPDQYRQPSQYLIHIFCQGLNICYNIAQAIEVHMYV